MEKIYPTDEKFILIGRAHTKYAGPKRYSFYASARQPLFQNWMENIQFFAFHLNSPILKQNYYGKMTSFEKSGLYPITMECQVVAQLIKIHELQPLVPSKDLFKTESHELPKTIIGI